MLRSAVVAGQFYPAQKEALLKSLTSLVPSKAVGRPAIAVMSPHAGYMYSGSVAGQVFAETPLPDEVIILGPNHHGRGHAAAVFADGYWETPLGKTAISATLADRILQECPMTAADETAHLYEHSLEVQLPFVQFCNADTRIVPICISRLPLETLLEMGKGIAKAAAAAETPPLIVASTDMTHYESGSVAREKDFMAIEKVLALDPVGLFDVVNQNRISMCGVMPTVVMLKAALSLGAVNAELVNYSNSGDITGDQSEVVGYAGVRIF